MNGNKPSRGEIWMVKLDSTVGHAQAKRRPCLIVSDDQFNHSSSKLCTLVPLTSKNKYNPLHVFIEPVGKLHKPSYIMCDQIRIVSLQRFSGSCWAFVGNEILVEVEYALKVLLNLP